MRRKAIENFVDKSTGEVPFLKKLLHSGNDELVSGAREVFLKGKDETWKKTILDKV